MTAEGKWHEDYSMLTIPILRGFRRRFNLFWKMVVKQEPLNVGISYCFGDNDVKVDWVKTLWD